MVTVPRMDSVRPNRDRKSTRLNSSHVRISTLSLHDAPSDLSDWPAPTGDPPPGHWAYRKPPTAQAYNLPRPTRCGPATPQGVPAPAASLHSDKPEWSPCHAWIRSGRTEIGRAHV